MKNKVMIAAFFSFLLFFISGYYLTIRMIDENKRIDTMQEKQVLNADQTIDENTEMIYQYFYSQDKVTKETAETAPFFLQGLNMDELQSIYEEWQIILFSSEKVILRCCINGMSSETYILGEFDGFLAVFYEDAQRGLHLKEKTKMPIATLQENEKELVKKGIVVTGEENLAKMLSDFMS